LIFFQNILRVERKELLSYFSWNKIIIGLSPSFKLFNSLI
jgi:hypothetical protein